MIKWKKEGLFLQPDTSKSWMKSHTMTPVVLHLNGNRYRVFFSTRNGLNQSHTGYADISVDSLHKKIQFIKFSKEPVMYPGYLGHFDDSGVTPSCVLNVGDKIFLYYIGWRARSTVRMELITGLAVSEDGGSTFVRYSKVPILSRNDNEPISILTSPYVVKDGNKFKMWYVSGIRWVNPDLPQYDIKYAESTDGISWNQTGKVAIALKEGENALARPFVLKEKGIYKMWYSYKRENYQLGFAESNDGINWIRKDEEVGILPSATGWDSDMIEFAYVFEHDGLKYMIYNGNEYGKYGMGYAVEQK